jgi:hypothetical protein
VPINAVLTGANVHDSRLALALTRISTQRVDACYELMDAAYCSTVTREEIQAAGRLPLIDHNPRSADTCGKWCVGWDLFQNFRVQQAIDLVTCQDVLQPVIAVTARTAQKTVNVVKLAK